MVGTELLFLLLQDKLKLGPGEIEPPGGPLRPRHPPRRGQRAGMIGAELLPPPAQASQRSFRATAAPGRAAPPPGGRTPGRSWLPAQGDVRRPAAFPECVEPCPATQRLGRVGPDATSSPRAGLASGPRPAGRRP